MTWTSAAVVIVTSAVRPAWTEGGLRQARPGVVVASAVRPAWTEGGLRQARPGVVVASAVRPAWTEGGLRRARPGSGPQSCRFGRSNEAAGGRSAGDTFGFDDPMRAAEDRGGERF